MSPATAELQRKSLAIALDATYKALEKPTKETLAEAQERWKMRTRCRHCGEVIVRWDDSDAEWVFGRSPLFVHDNRVDVDCDGIDCDRDGETFAEPMTDWELAHFRADPASRPLLHHEDDEPFSCLTCEDERYIEVPQRKLGAFGEVARTEPWATETVPCPDCNAGGAR